MENKTLSEKIASEIIAYIRDNKLMPAARLPGVRALADILKTSKNTICDALELLVQEGMVETKAASGSFITKNAWMEGRGSLDWCKFIDYGKEKSDETIIEKILTEKKDGDISLNSNSLDSSFGFGEMLASVLDEIKNEITSTDVLLQYSALGPLSLRNAVSSYLEKYKGIKADPANIIIFPTNQNALNIVVEALTGNRRGSGIYAEKAWCTMLKNTDLYSRSRIDVHDLPSDREGVTIEAVKRIPGDDGKTKSILLINPTRQYLEYRAMSNRRKYELLDVCSRLKLPIIEIDYFSDFMPNLKHLKAMDKGGDVIYIGALHSYAQTGINTAWIVAPEYVVPRIVKLSIMSGTDVPSLNYLIVEKMLAGGHYRRFLDFASPKIAERISLTNSLLDKYMGDIASWQREPGCGIFYVKMKESISVKKMYEIRGNISFIPGSYLEPEDDSNICLCSCFLPANIMEKAIAGLSDIARRVEKLS